ncbi:exodeoxyribonuclease V subunit alpha [Nocardioides zeae]|uniref:RecBCD enzyme subunit RecD n=1 Tax=Nocardioides zeae TaxID=1457234 RepID=A0AAJ1U944_9ACTN|nr:exodeoxyribonuclease V subunit alpha [Nocardioides zeae]MDQ1106397.1 exodeoxyribonuclease V alpha subunit [Nocardioides zeae]
MSELFEPDGPHDHRIAAVAPEGLLRDLNHAGVLTAADVQVATRVGGLAVLADGRGAEHDLALLALALCVRSVRGGSVCLDLASVAASTEVPTGWTWPDHDAWCAAIDGSALVATGVLHRAGSLVHLDRYLREERQVADDLRLRERQPAPGVDLGLLEQGVTRVFPAPGDEEQRAAARHALTHRTTVLTGGPGTGKTTAVAGLLALLAEQAERGPGGRPPRVALAAPTGKAAARLTEAVAESARRFSPADQDRVARLVQGAPATTLHRLLGARPDSSVRFRHHRGNRLPHDVVVVDEASMLSLTLTARLLEAVRPDARLLLVGDPDQLASVEAGAVLADLVAGFGEQDGPVVRLRTSHRFGASIGTLAAALRDGDTDGPGDGAGEDAGVLGLLRGVRRAPGSPADPSEPVGFVDLAEPATEAALDEALRPLVLPMARAVRAAALAGDGAAALALLAEHRLLCAHRSGPAGVAAQNRRVEAWLAEEDPGVVPGGSYAGRPLLVSRNDPGLGLANGDTGVVVRAPDGSFRAVFATAGASRELALSRVGDVETMHALTIHKAQGSQAERITVLLPGPESRLLTRELLYTAVTRAQRSVCLVGSEEAIGAAVGRHVQRASGLRERLRATEGPG